MKSYFKNFYELKNLIPLYAIYQYVNEISIVISQSWLHFLFFFLKNSINYQYSLLSCISGVDLLGKYYRYCIVYDLLSLTFNTRIRIKSLINLNMISYSITNIFSSANWWEREIWDMFGIFFKDHPDLRRILTDYGFEGYPLKKDFPLFGFVELRYNENKKKVVLEPVILTQKYRTFNFEMPW
jgi:NADH:ubiquinone oxidoreductase subunit C